MTAAAVGLILDSLDDIHCLLESRFPFSMKNHIFATEPEELDPEEEEEEEEEMEAEQILFSVLCDQQLQQLLNLYDQINSSSYR